MCPGFSEHQITCLLEDRLQIIPWLNSIRPLSGQSIIEIGCGTGSSTVALAEQGANLVGIDLDQRSLSVARARLKAYGLKAALININACDLSKTFGDTKFDHIILFASIEHMNYSERISSLLQAKSLLLPGGLLSIIETPNRLWFHDGHTSKNDIFSLA